MIQETNACNNPLLSKLWKVTREVKGIYTGGKVQASQDGQLLACALNDDVAIVSNKGELLYTIQQNQAV